MVRDTIRLTNNEIAPFRAPVFARSWSISALPYASIEQPFGPLREKFHGCETCELVYKTQSVALGCDMPPTLGLKMTIHVLNEVPLQNTRISIHAIYFMFLVACNKSPV